MIRTLRPGDPVPAGEPRRYLSRDGYMRLRWLVGPDQYVEVYEHRLVAGLPEGHVHHKDHNKLNNDPANLEVLDIVEHARHHGAENSARSKRMCEWGGLHSQAAYDKRQSRLRREQKHKELLESIADMYQSGLKTTEIAKRIGRDNSMVSRALKTLGVQARGNADYMAPIDLDLIRQWHAQGVRGDEMRRRLRVGRNRIDAALDELGLPRFAPGRPQPPREQDPAEVVMAHSLYGYVRLTNAGGVA